MGFTLNKPEAVYRIDQTSGEALFSLDCRCGGKTSVCENVPDGFREIAKSYKSEDGEHTFVMGLGILSSELKSLHNMENKQAPLIVICSNCRREYEFSYQMFQELRQKIKYLQ